MTTMLPQGRRESETQTPNARFFVAINPVPYGADVCTSFVNGLCGAVAFFTNNGIVLLGDTQKCIPINRGASSLESVFVCQLVSRGIIGVILRLWRRRCFEVFIVWFCHAPLIHEILLHRLQNTKCVYIIACFEAMFWEMYVYASAAGVMKLRASLGLGPLALNSGPPRVMGACTILLIGMAFLHRAVCVCEQRTGGALFTPSKNGVCHFVNPLGWCVCLVTQRVH